MAYFRFDDKKVYYKECGSGEPILLLPGNTASSIMFNSILEKYAKSFKVILIDFPGHGKSERLKRFESDFWFYNSTVCFKLLEELNINKITVIGTSGGALIGINLALEHPEKVQSLVADSFIGDYPPIDFTDKIKEEREKSKKNEITKEYWYNNHGADWETVVDLDTEMLIGFSKSGHSFFHKSISELSVPTLLTGSKEDEFLNSLEKTYSDLKKKNDRLEICMFETGNHPAILSNKEKFYSLIKEK